MGINHYFNNFHNKAEQHLVEDLIVESIKMFGMMVLYVPRDFVKLDRLFGEDTQAAFTKTYPIEMYFDSVSGFDGERSILSKFGLDIRKQANFVVSRRRFDEAIKFEGPYAVPISTATMTEVRPREGDIIYLPMTNDLWEIEFAEHESVFYQLGKNYIWRITVHKFVKAGEKFNTGVGAIDKIGAKYQNKVGQPGVDFTDQNANPANPLFNQPIGPIANNDDLQAEWDGLVNPNQPANTPGPAVKPVMPEQDWDESNPFAPGL